MVGRIASAERIGFGTERQDFKIGCMEDVIDGFAFKRAAVAVERSADRNALLAQKFGCIVQQRTYFRGAHQNMNGRDARRSVHITGHDGGEAPGSCGQGDVIEEHLGPDFPGVLTLMVQVGVVQQELRSGCQFFKLHPGDHARVVHAWQTRARDVGSFREPEVIGLSGSDPCGKERP